MGDDFDAEAWLAGQVIPVEQLVGQVVSDWRGVEMAIRETTETGPQSGDHEVSCVQLVYLVASLKTDDVASFTTYQDDDLFGLRIGRSAATTGRASTALAAWPNSPPAR